MDLHYGPNGLNGDQISFWCTRRLAYAVWETVPWIFPEVQRAEWDFGFVTLFFMNHPQHLLFIRGQTEGRQYVTVEDLEREFGNYISGTVYAQLLQAADMYLPNMLYGRPEAAS